MLYAHAHENILEVYTLVVLTIHGHIDAELHRLLTCNLQNMSEFNYYQEVWVLRI